MASKTPAKKATPSKAVKKPTAKSAKEITKAVLKPTVKAAQKEEKVEKKVQAVKKESTAKLPPKAQKPEAPKPKEMKLGKTSKAKKPEFITKPAPVEEVLPYQALEKKETPRPAVKPPATAIFTNKVHRKDTTREALDSIREKMAGTMTRAINTSVTEEVEEKTTTMEQTVTTMERMDARRPAPSKKREIADGKVSFEDIMQSHAAPVSGKPFFDAESFLRK